MVSFPGLFVVQKRLALKAGELRYGNEATAVVVSAKAWLRGYLKPWSMSNQRNNEIGFQVAPRCLTPHICIPGIIIME